MKNTMVMGNNEMQAVAMTVMNDVKASKAKVDTLEDMFNVASNYIQVTKDQFEKCLNDLQNNFYQNQELSEDQLDMVVGGNVFGDVADWFKDHAMTIGIVVAAVLISSGAFACLGAGVGAAIGAIGGSAATGAVSGAAFGVACSLFGAVIGAPIAIANNDFKDGLPF